MKIFKRKKKEEKKPFVSWESVLMNDEAVSFDDAERFLAGVFKTPETNATIRLQGNAAMEGAESQSDLFGLWRCWSS